MDIVDSNNVVDVAYRDTSLIRKTPPPIGPYSSPIPRDLR